jgi:hypothetical protein
MTPEQSLREKLRKIEALFAGAATLRIFVNVRYRGAERTPR